MPSGPNTTRTVVGLVTLAGASALVTAMAHPLAEKQPAPSPTIEYIYVPQTTTIETTIIHLLPGQTAPPNSGATVVTNPAPRATAAPPIVHAVTGGSGKP